MTFPQNHGKPHKHIVEPNYPNTKEYIWLYIINLQRKTGKKKKSMLLEFRTMVKIPEVNNHLPILPDTVLFPEQKKMREMTHYV